MRLAPAFLNVPIAAALSLCCLFPQTVSAVTLNFSATLYNGTCTLNLDKSALRLPDVSLSSLAPQRLYSAQPFKLSVTECTGGGASNLTPMVAVTGPGVSQDNKWLFRQANSAPGMGIMVFQTDDEPGYGLAELRSGATLPLADVGKKPVDQTLGFYAAASCISSQSCADVGTGVVTASLMFIFAYQ